MTALLVALVVSLVVGVAALGVAGLLTVATFTSIRDLIRQPLSTLPTQPIDMDLPPHRPAGRHRRARRRVAHAGLDLRASLRAAADA